MGSSIAVKMVAVRAAPLKAARGAGNRVSVVETHNALITRVVQYKLVSIRVRSLLQVIVEPKLERDAVAFLKPKGSATVRLDQRRKFAISAPGARDIGGLLSLSCHVRTG